VKLGAPIPFREALRRVAIRREMPTHLGTADLQAMDAGILRTSFFSARNAITSVLSEMKRAVLAILNPTEISRPDRVEPGNPGGLVTVGLSQPEARQAIRAELKAAGYVPATEDRGTIKDFTSQQRLDLIIQTQVQTAQGYGYAAQGMDPAILDQWPAQELIRAEARNEERDWSARWLAAARSVGDAEAITAWGTTGRMVARKDSPVWQALGDGAGGFDSDALHNPHPPFAFNSGMDVMDVDRDDAVQLGLLGRDDQVTPDLPAYGAGLVEVAA
jgi:hypothetical protein